jgi:hypothetical protein
VAKSTGRGQAVERFRQLPTEWHDPETWNREPYSHTITVTTYRSFGLCVGNTLLLKEKGEREPLRGGPGQVWPLYVFCSRALDGGPTEPIFGRAVAYYCDVNGYKATLKTRDVGHMKVSTKTHPLVYRVVGMIGAPDALPWQDGPSAAFRLFPRSETPLEVPSKVTPDMLTLGMDGANQEKHNFGHAIALLALLGDEISAPESGRTDIEWQELGNRVEYVVGQLERHVLDLGKSLDTIDEARARLRRGE